MALLILALFCGCVDDGFHCSSSDLEQSLPRLKILLKSDSYSKLEALHHKLVDANRRRQPYPSPQQVGSMIASCVGVEEQPLCFAAIRIKHGMLSVTDPFIARYLELDQSAMETLRKLNTGCVNDIKQLVSKFSMDMAVEQFVPVLVKSRGRYLDGMSELKKHLAPRQVQLFDALFQSFNHDQVVINLVSRFKDEKWRAEVFAKAYAKAHPNVQLFMRAKGLIFMEHKVARDYLELTQEQIDDVAELYMDYDDAVAQLQRSLSDALSREPTFETPKSYIRTAQSLNAKYTAQFMKLLTSRQKTLLVKLHCQVVGYKYCVTSPVKEIIGITPEQDSNFLSFSVRCIEENPESMKDSELDYERLYRFARYHSERVKNEMLTAEQREKWKEFVGNEIPESELVPLQKDFIKKTAPNIKPVNIKKP